MKPTILSNKNMLQEIIACRKTAIVSDVLKEMLDEIVERIATRNWGKEKAIEARQIAKNHLYSVILRFDLEKSDNPYAWCIQVSYHSFHKSFRLSKSKTSALCDC